MRTSARKPKASQHSALTGSKNPCLSPSGKTHAAQSLPHLQSTIGNQAVQRLLKAPDGEREGRSTHRFAFSVNPVQHETPRNQTAQPAQNNSTPRPMTGAPYQYRNDGTGRNKTEQSHLLKSSVKQLDTYKPDDGTLRRWQHNSEGVPLPASQLEKWSHQLGSALPPVYLHQDQLAGRLAAAKGADAVTIGNHIYLGEVSPSPSLMAHEMTHVAQAHLHGVAAPVGSREREARESEFLFAQGIPCRVEFPGSTTEPMTHPAVKVLLRAGRWLLRRTTRSISRHIARHGRRIAGRAVHSVFRNPRAIRRLVSQTIREGTELARRATRHGADEVLEGGGVRVFRQATGTPGKFRYVVEKNFERAIGTRGERILRIIIDQSGRLVTAFPVDRFMTLGLTAGAVTIFSARTASAGERVRERIEAEENRPTDWVGEILDFLNPLSGGSLNEGEDLLLDIDRIITETTVQVIRDIEETEHTTLDPIQREAIRDLVEVGVGSPLELENIEEE